MSFDTSSHLGGFGLFTTMHERRRRNLCSAVQVGIFALEFGQTRHAFDDVWKDWLDRRLVMEDDVSGRWMKGSWGSDAALGEIADRSYRGTTRAPSHAHLSNHFLQVSFKADTPHELHVSRDYQSDKALSSVFCSNMPVCLST